MAAKHWEHFPHGADVGIRGLGTTRAEAFEEAALALTAVITDPHLVEPRELVEVACDAPDDELLLVDWLNALIFEMATRRMLFGRFDVRLEDHHLYGRARGEPIHLARHRPAVEVKGATYTALRVRCEPDDTWIAQCDVDV